LAEAEQIIKADKPAAAQTYIRVEQSKLPLAFVEKIVADPEIDFTVTPTAHLHLCEQIAGTGRAEKQGRQLEGLLLRRGAWHAG